MPGWRVLVVGAASMLAAGLDGCVNHPVGPARTFDDFEGKAVTTAESARSAVETVRLLATVSDEGRGFAGYDAVSVSEQEDSLGGVRGTFASIQPPDDRSVELRDELIPILDDAFDGVGDVRIQLRRGNAAGLADPHPPLDEVSAALDAFIEEHS